jgi:hypothetical protein
MADIMPQSNRFYEVFIQPEKTANGARDFGNQLYMKHPVRNVIIVYQIKDLGLVYVPCVGQGMQDAIRVRRIVLPVSGIYALVRETANSILAASSKRRKEDFFPFVQELFYPLQID